MKKKFLNLAIAAIMAAGFSSCMVSAPGSGAIYTDVKQGEIATSNVRGSKKGTSTANAYLGLIAIGDCSIDTAAKNGGITRISHVDSHKKSILGIINTTVTIVYGE